MPSLGIHDSSDLRSAGSSSFFRAMNSASSIIVLAKCGACPRTCFMSRVWTGLLSLSRTGVPSGFFLSVRKWYTPAPNAPARTSVRRSMNLLVCFSHSIVFLLSQPDFGLFTVVQLEDDLDHDDRKADVELVESLRRRRESVD